MSLAINHNSMASNAARNLGLHYAGMATSVRRLSSGLRVGTAADDAAGLAIRELMRADITALNQGVRNTNDAISMLQTADGALEVIDEKLIRLKELAEQAATGTYTSDQRLMIDKEFQDMKAEITRIANATDFNGIKLLCNDISNKILVSWGPGGPVREPWIQGGQLISFPEIINFDAVTVDAKIRYGERAWNITSNTGDENIKLWQMASFHESGQYSDLKNIAAFTCSYDAGAGSWSLDANTQAAFASAGKTVQVSGLSDDRNLTLSVTDTGTGATTELTFMYGNLDPLTQDTTINLTQKAAPVFEFYSGKNEYPHLAYLGSSDGMDWYDLDGDNIGDIRTINDDGHINLYADYDHSWEDEDGNQGIWWEGKYATKIHFGTGNDSAEDYYYIETWNCTADGLGIEGVKVTTQERAQRALDELDHAIIQKDRARAYFGAMQNRLENTAANLAIQSENLQAAESRISDVDVAEEMTKFVRLQVLTQAATAMLAQANSMPQMALQLLNG